MRITKNLPDEPQLRHYRQSKTRLEALIERFNTKAQARFYIENLGGDFEDYESEHENFHESLNQVQSNLTGILKYKIIDRTHLPAFIFAKDQVILTVGQDGLVANTAKYAAGVPIMGINPDKSRNDGVLLPFDPHNFVSGLKGVISNDYHSITRPFAEARLSDGQKLLAFNDLFIGASSHISARYRISFNNKIEQHSSSGIIVSTQAGATGWLSSVFNMAYGITGLFEPNLEPRYPKIDDDQLLFAVREPFQSVRTQTGITSGLINQKENLTIESLMPIKGVIFSDGIEQDFLTFNSGSIVQIGLARERAVLVTQAA